MSTKRKLPAKFAAPAVKAKNARTPSKQILSETNARAVVGHAGLDAPEDADTQETIDLISNSEGESEDEDLDEDEEDTANFHAEENDNDDVDMAEGEDGNEEATFGDLALAHSEHPISVSAAFPSEAKQKSKNALALPSGASLGVALSQALKTTDYALLESCLQTTDIATIRSTISRLPPPLAGNLLTLLAARLHRRPGRAGSLMVWIQWTLVTHGGYLASQRGMVRKLEELGRVVEERAKGLQGLLALKGKLDLLDGVMMVRRSVRDARRQEDEAEDDDEDVIYVEGEDDEDSEDDASGLGVQVNGKKRQKIGEMYEGSDSDVSDDMPDTYGGMDIDEDEDSEDDDDEEGLIDDEAESTDDDEGDDDGDDVEFDDEDEDAEEDSEAEALAAAAAMSRTPKSAKKSRR